MGLAFWWNCSGSRLPLDRPFSGRFERSNGYLSNFHSRAMPKPLWAIRFGPSTLDRSLRAMRFGPSTLDCPLWTVPFWPSTLDRPLWTVHFGLIYSLKSDQYSVYDISWMTNSLVLGTESFFCDHTGVVHFDPGQGSMNRIMDQKNFLRTEVRLNCWPSCPWTESWDPWFSISRNKISTLRTKRLQCHGGFL